MRFKTVGEGVVPGINCVGRFLAPYGQLEAGLSGTRQLTGRGP
jgi:hypothetical protein